MRWFLFIVIIIAINACKKDTSSRDKFFGIYVGERICYNPAFLTEDTTAITININSVEWSDDSLEVVIDGVDSSFARQMTSFGGKILDFNNEDFAGELKGNDTLVIYDVAAGFSCETQALRQ